MTIDRVVFVVQHVHVHSDGEENVKLIGCYGSREGADAAVARLQLKPGFADSPDGFTVDEYALDEDNWTDGFVTVLFPDGSTDERAGGNG